MTKRRAGQSVRILLSTACLALVLASCGGGDDDDDGSNDVSVPTQTESAPSEPADSPAAQDDASLSLEDAAAVAVKAVDNSSLLTIETELNRTIWEATVVKRNGTEHEMLIAKSDGSFFDGPTKQADDAEDKAENRRLVRAADLGYEKAARAIADSEPKARLLELSLDMYKDRIPSWEGHLYGTDGIWYSVTIDARSGDVLEKDADADDDD